MENETKKKKTATTTTATEVATSRALESYVDRVTLYTDVNADNFDFSRLPADPFKVTITTHNAKGEEIKTAYKIAVNGNKTLTVNDIPVNDGARERLTKLLADRERIPNEVAGLISSDTCKIYRYFLSRAKEQDKKERFERSGVKFVYKGVELRFLPKHAIDAGCEFILFKAITGDATTYLKRDNETFSIGVLAKGGKSAILKDDIVELTRPLLLKLMNDTFNGLTWSRVLELCREVEKFGTCTVPKALKD